MKRENYQRVTEIIKKIEENEYWLTNLKESSDLIIKNEQGYDMLEITLYGSDGNLVAITNNFIEAVKIHFETEIEKLNKELETL